jgi:hypothetical protein
MRPSLTPELIDFLKTGETKDADVYLDWAGERGRDKSRELFKAIRGDYPAGTFPWAEKEFGGKR